MDLPENIYRTKDGVLLLTGGGHSTAAYFNGDKKPTEASQKNFWANHASRRDWCARNGYDFRMVVFPDKLAPYAEDMEQHPGIESIYLRDYKSFQNGGQITYLDMKKSDYLYTDTHFSSQGIKSATKQYLHFLGIMDHDVLEEAYESCLHAENNFVGDLGVKCDPKISEETHILKGIRRGKYATNNVETGNDGIIDINVNHDSAHDLTLLIFGDSFFRQLIPCLSLFFRKIFFLRSRFFHYEMVEAISPDIISTGMAERYLSNVASDRIRPHALAYPLMRGRSTNPTASFSSAWNDVVDSSKLSFGGFESAS